jgi:hypothetical protein
MRSPLLAFLASVALALVACGGSDPSSNDASEAQSADEALTSRVHCNSVDDCSAAFDDGKWKIAAKTVDRCVQNHDFPYVCMSCSTKGVCSFHPGF